MTLASIAAVVVIGLFVVIMFSWPWLLGAAMDAWPKWRDAHHKRLLDRMQARAMRRRADGSRGRRARRALRALARRSRPGDRMAVLWKVWLAYPDDQVWDLLDSRYRQIAFVAAINPREPTRSEVVAFCADRGLAPEEASERAMFFVLTGQQVQHRTEDPDGTLLAAAYRAAREDERDAVRQALAGADDLDLVRVVAGAGRDTAPTVTHEEARYLAWQLAGRRDWAGLWQLALDLPVAGAVFAGSNIGDGWQPADDAARALLQRLAGADWWQISEFSADSRQNPQARPAAAVELIRRPLALMTPADLAAVTKLLRTHSSKPLELLAACLEYRFGSEIALGAQGPVAPGRPDDVGVSPSPEPQPPAPA